MKTPLPYYGSKVSLGKRIEKPRADVEILSDLNLWHSPAVTSITCGQSSLF